jgi:hypothetical protein
MRRRALVVQRRVNVGGTSGGFGEFLCGVVLIVIGFYMIFTNTVVHTNFWHFHGYNLLGPLIMLFMVGLVFLFMQSKSVLGWLFSGGAVVAMVVGIIMNLRLHFKSMTLLSSLIMFGLPAIGVGLTLRSLRSHER